MYGCGLARRGAFYVLWRCAFYAVTVARLVLVRARYIALGELDTPTCTSSVRALCAPHLREPTTMHHPHAAYASCSAENLPSLSSVRVLYSGTVSRVVLSTEFTTAASVPRFAYQSNGGGESKHCDARSRQSPQLSRRVTVHRRAISIFFLFNSGGARNYVGPNHF